MYKLDLEKAQEPEIKLPIFAGLQRKQENSRKNTYICFLDCTKALTVWITTNCRKFSKTWEYQNTLPLFLRNLYADKEAMVRTRHVKTDWFKIGKEVQSRLYIVTLLT